MNVPHTIRTVSDRTLGRLIAAGVLTLVIGIPLVGVVYFVDRHVDPGPSMVERQISAAEDAVRQEPNRVGARLQLAVTYMAAGRYADAVTQFSQVLAVEAGQRAALMGRGKAELALGNLDAAAGDFRAIVDAAKGGEMENVDPQLEAAYYHLGSIALTRGRADEAAGLLAAALAIDRTDADALYLLGTALIETGQPGEATKALRLAVRFVPTGWCEPYAELGRAYTALGEMVGASYAAGMVDLCEGRPEEAATTLGAIPAGPYAADAALGLGFAAEAEGRLDDALGYYQKTLLLDPTNFNAGEGVKRLGSGSSEAVPGESQPADAVPAGDG